MEAATEGDDRAASSSPARRRWRWLRFEAVSLGDIALQIFSVVAGILLALFIDNWSTERHQRATVDAAMVAIRAELASNRVALRDHAHRMFEMAKRTRESTSNAGQPPRRCYELDTWRGIGGLNLVDAAYQAAIATQALAHMPFAEASAVSQTYGWQRYFQKGFDLDATLLMGNPQSVEFCAGIIEGIGRDDVQLDAEYERLIGNGAAPTAPEH
jgi:hypothetical protein